MATTTAKKSKTAKTPAKAAAKSATPKVRLSLDEVMRTLKQAGTAQTKKTFMRHGAKEPYFGVKIGDMKKIQRKVKKDHTLSLALYDTGNADAMILATMLME